MSPHKRGPNKKKTFKNIESKKALVGQFSSHIHLVQQFHKNCFIYKKCRINHISLLKEQAMITLQRMADERFFRE